MADGAAHRDVSFGEAASLAFKNYSNFDGRSSRGAFWWWFLICTLISAGLATIDVGVLGAEQSGYYTLAMLFALGILTPTIALGVRRLHDIDRSCWWMLFFLVPFGGLVILFAFFTLPGKRADTRFGPDVEAGR